MYTGKFYHRRAHVRAVPSKSQAEGAGGRTRSFSIAHSAARREKEDKRSGTRSRHVHKSHGGIEKKKKACAMTRDDWHRDRKASYFADPSALTARIQIQVNRRAEIKVVIPIATRREE